MSDDLFRKEVVEGQKDSFLGEVLLIQPLSITIWTGFVAGIAVFLLAFLIWGSYTPRETARGYLVPDKGVAKLYAPSAGTVTELLVQEGTLVEAGDLLLVASTARALQEGSDIDTVSLEQIDYMTEELVKQVRGEESLWLSETEKLQQQMESLKQETVQLTQQVQTQADRLAIVNRRLEGVQRLRDQGHLSELGFQNYQEEYLAQKQQWEDLKRQLINKKSGLENAEAALKAFPVQEETKISNLKNQLGELLQKKAETIGRKQIVMKAPISGIVTALQVKPGQQISANTLLLMSILPQNTELYAELYLPTRAMGFVEKGASVYLRYDAFPHEKFGAQKGTVIEITKTILNPNELPVALKIEDPVYRVIVQLDKQTIYAYEKEFHLEAGILVEADIVLGKRSLLKWILAPLYNFRQRL